VDTVSVMHPRVSSEPGDASKGDVPYIRNGGRREYKEWFKAQVIEECHAPGNSVSIVARRYNINTNVLFRWRREYQLGILKPTPRPNPQEAFLPVGVIGEDGKLVPPAPSKSAIAATASVPSAEAKPQAVKALAAPAPVPSPTQRPPPPGIVELYLSNRIKIRIQGDVNKDALRGVLAVARELA